MAFTLLSCVHFQVATFLLPIIMEITWKSRNFGAVLLYHCHFYGIMKLWILRALVFRLVSSLAVETKTKRNYWLTTLNFNFGFYWPLDKKCWTQVSFYVFLKSFYIFQTFTNISECIIIKKVACDTQFSHECFDFSETNASFSSLDTLGDASWSTLSLSSLHL